MKKTMLKGSSLVGTSTTRERIKGEYYATPYESTEALFNVESFDGNLFLEPCIGGGHIVKVVKKYYPNSKIYGCDIIDRGYNNTKICDFLKEDFKQKFDNVITNPPYSLAQEFLKKTMTVVKENGKIAMFLKIQFLEGVRRKELFEIYPPKTVYVFSKRQAPWRNGSPVDEKGKKWASTMCFAWFVWVKGYKGETIVKWL